MREHPRSEDGGWHALPAVYDGSEGQPGPVLLTVEVDGEMFAIRPSWGSGTHYDWLTGPNEGYGFASSAPPNQSLEDHRKAIRSFLGMIDPATGFIADD
jgi:hypothetical protein